MNESVLKKLAKPMLILAPIIWGTSFVVMKHSLDSFTPFYLLAFRFTAAAIVLGLVFWKSWKVMDRQYFKAGAIIGTFLFLAYAFQTFGLDRTTSGKNAFLTAVYCVIVPFLYWLIARKRPDRYNILAAVVCIVGIGLVSLSNDGGALSINLGDVLTLIGGFFFAAHIVAVNKYAEGRDIFLITTLQFAFFGAWSWVGALAVREPFPAAVFRRRPVRYVLPGDLLLLRGPSVPEHRAEVHRARHRGRAFVPGSALRRTVLHPGGGGGAERPDGAGLRADLFRRHLLGDEIRLPAQKKG